MYGIDMYTQHAILSYSYQKVVMWALVISIGLSHASNLLKRLNVACTVRNIDIVELDMNVYQIIVFVLIPRS